MAGGPFHHGADVDSESFVGSERRLRHQGDFVLHVAWGRKTSESMRGARCMLVARGRGARGCGAQKDGERGCLVREATIRPTGDQGRGATQLSMFPDEKSASAL